MWRGHEAALIRYGVVICEEWTRRGFKDTVREKLLARLPEVDAGDPGWLGMEPFHASHRSSLIRKDPRHYGQFGWTDDPAVENVWPV